MMYHENFKPLLAAKCDLLSLTYPIAVTEKLDGVRVIVRDGVAYSRSLKPIRSRMVQKILGSLPSGCDGEVLSNDGNFQTSISSTMAEDGELNWTYHIFDYLDFSTKEIAPYSERMNQLVQHQELGKLNEHCRIVYPQYVYDRDHLLEIVKEHLAAGHEGTMVRDPKGGYKFGRSTIRQGLLLKIKAFEDAEARIVGVEELMHNENEAETNELGYTKRSTHQENQVPGDTLGALVVQSLQNPDITFKIGTGFDAEQRKELWQQRESLIGKLAKYKFFNQGILHKPRHPVFLGIRHPDDLSAD